MLLGYRDDEIVGKSADVLFPSEDGGSEAAAEERRTALALGRAEDERWQMRFGFDLSKVRVLQEDLYRLAQRLDLAVRGGWGRVGEARRGVGLPVDDADNIYLRPLNVAEVPADGGAPRSLAPASSNGNGSLNGHASEIADELERRLDRRELVTAS